MAYNLGPVRAHVKANAERIGPMFGIVTIHGWRATDRFMDEHPAGLALDYMCDIPTGTALSQYHIDNATALGTKTIIHNRRSWNSTRKTWVPYSSTDNPHTDHVHVLYHAIPGVGTLLPAGFSPTGNPVSAAKETLDRLEKLFGMLNDPATWVRVSMFIGGVLFIGIGVFGATNVKQAIGKVAKSAKP